MRVAQITRPTLHVSKNHRADKTPGHDSRPVPPTDLVEYVSSRNGPARSIIRCHSHPHQSYNWPLGVVRKLQECVGPFGPRISATSRLIGQISVAELLRILLQAKRTRITTAKKTSDPILRHVHG